MKRTQSPLTTLTCLFSSRIWSAQQPHSGSLNWRRLRYRSRRKTDHASDEAGDDQVVGDSDCCPKHFMDFSLTRGLSFTHAELDRNQWYRLTRRRESDPEGRLAGR